MRLSYLALMRGESCDLDCFLKDQKACFCFLGVKFWLLPSDPQKENQKISRSHCCWQWAFLEPHFSFPLLTANFKGLTFESFGVKRSCRSGGGQSLKWQQRTLLLVGSSSKDERWKSGVGWLGAYGWAFASLGASIEPLPPWVPVVGPLLPGVS